MLTRLLSLLMFSTTALTAHAQSANPIVGTWKLIAADKLLPDGKTRVADYGASPYGMAVFTADGHYMIEVYRAERPKFAANDRAKGTADEYKEAVLGASCAYGTYTVDVATSKLTVNIEGASFPNFEKTTQVRSYELKGNTLSWKVAPRPDGSVPITVVQRVK